MSQRIGPGLFQMQQERSSWIPPLIPHLNLRESSETKPALEHWSLGHLRQLLPQQFPERSRFQVMFAKFSHQVPQSQVSIQAVELEILPHYPTVICGTIRQPIRSRRASMVLQ